MKPREIEELENYESDRERRRLMRLGLTPVIVTNTQMSTDLESLFAFTIKTTKNIPRILFDTFEDHD